MYVAEVNYRIEHLPKRVKPKGKKIYVTFGECMSKSYCQESMSTTSCCFVDKELLHTLKRDRPWDKSLLCIMNYDKKAVINKCNIIDY